jgi:succinate-acetate transporter protein
MFYGVNWIFLFSIIFMLNKIRHIKDRLKVREEMGYIVASWTVFCYAQFTLYLFA